MPTLYVQNDINLLRPVVQPMWAHNMCAYKTSSSN